MLLALIRSEQDKEECLHASKQLLAKGPYKDYVIENRLLMRKVSDKTVVTLPLNMHHEIIRKAHKNSYFGGKIM